MSDKETGSKKCVDTLTENALELYALFSNAKSEECVMLDKEGIQHKPTTLKRKESMTIYVTLRMV